ncbi:MAG TPA: hybrid sensor histidine kinase/response regulator [Geobacter sp.]|nr:hybrid sensor histidine kinase/response regulator [Geobacter sp.]
MLASFRDLSIRRKLIAILVLTNSIVLAVVSAAFVVNEATMFRSEARTELAALAKMVGHNTSAAVAFNDGKSAVETLLGLRAKPDITAALVTLKDGSVLASYLAAGVELRQLPFLEGSGEKIRIHDGKLAAELKRSGSHFAVGNDIYGVAPVVLDGQQIGTVVIRSDSRDLAGRLTRFFILVACIMVGALLLVFFLAAMLQRLISGPIMNLAQVIEAVAKNKSYSLRARKEGNDELGTLIDGFNEMLVQIQERDQKLEAHRVELEEVVQSRTMQLREANEELSETVVQLRVSKDAAEAASVAKSQFLANMSHEIRTPMNGVLGMVSLLLESGLAGDQRRFAEAVRSSGESLLSIINDILDFSKIEAGRMELQPAPFDLHGMMREVLEMFSNGAQRKGVGMSLQMADGVPRHVEGDPVRLRQVLVNLLGNAVKFTSHGEVLLRVGRGGGDLVRFEVVDSGIGIRPEARQHIFESFSQADYSTTRTYGGTGLGLAIARQLAELMGGELGLESEYGAGSTFWFTASLKGIASLPEDLVRQASEPVPQPKLYFEASILVAEDNPVNQDVARHMLDLLGCRVEIAENGKEAMAAAGEGRYDLIFMDCQMPQVDGFAATRAIREMEAAQGKERLPIVALTANAIAGDRERCLDAGMDDYLSKPFDLRQLRDVLQRWLPEPGVAAADAVGSAGEDQESGVVPARGEGEAAGDEDAPPPVFDYAGLANRLGGEDFIGMFVDKYIASTTKLMLQLKEAIGEGDVPDIYLHSHSVKGAAASVGAESMRAIALRMETAAKEGLDLSGVPGLYADLEQAFAAFSNLAPGAIRR